MIQLYSFVYKVNIVYIPRLAQTRKVLSYSSFLFTVTPNHCCVRLSHNSLCSAFCKSLKVCVSIHISFTDSGSVTFRKISYSNPSISHLILVHFVNSIISLKSMQSTSIQSQSMLVVLCPSSFALLYFIFQEYGQIARLYV